MIVERFENAGQWVSDIATVHVGRDEALQSYAMFDSNDRNRTEELELAVRGISGKYFCSVFTLTAEEIKEINSDADVEAGLSYTFIMA